ncbi:MAG: YwbE family protein [Deltaproteobacteria bacterium]|nr:YwbE family protein [Deltaproteobacteria bacterium]
MQKGAQVSIVTKANQRTGKRAVGIVKDILTRSSTHLHGIKVRLEDGQVGRVKDIL